MKPTKVILHCAVTPDSLLNDPNFDRFGANDIDEWHKERGFKKIGYHYVIRRTGVIEQGRSPNEKGAHCLENNGNKNSLGICLIGTKLFTSEQLESLEDLYLKHLEADNINWSDWFGHCEFDPENKPHCPGLDMDTLRDRLAKLGEIK